MFDQITETTKRERERKEVKGTNVVQGKIGSVGQQAKWSLMDFSVGRGFVRRTVHNGNDASVERQVEVIRRREEGSIPGLCKVKLGHSFFLI